MSSDSEFVPACKPLRLIEYGFVVLCFLLLFHFRNYIPHNKIILTPRDLIIFFTTYGSLMILTGSDIVSQFLRKPTPNKPMFIIAIVGATLCTFCGFSLIFIYKFHETDDSFRILNICILLSALSFGTAIAYIMDGIVLQRFS